MFAIGQEIVVKNYRGKEENFAGQIVQVRDILENQLTPKQVKRERMLRSNKLVTVKATTGEYRSFYTEFIHG